MYKAPRIFSCSLLLLIAALLVTPSGVRADSQDELLLEYSKLKNALDNNVYGIPVYIRSSDSDEVMLGEVYGIIPHPYNNVRTALITPEDWCDIAPLHLNIKACTYQAVANKYRITLYAGRKFYEKADDVFKQVFRYEPSRSDDHYFHISLHADDGPVGTSDYLIEVDAVALDEAHTFVHFIYSYHPSFLGTLGMKTYLATLGRDKVGFSVTGNDDKGQPAYVAGVRGIIERNTIRYYFAIESFLDTLKLKPEQRFNARLNRWFDLTEQYPRQLHELDKNDYLGYKQQEHLDQLRLQKQLEQTTGD